MLQDYTAQINCRIARDTDWQPNDSNRNDRGYPALQYTNRNEKRTRKIHTKDNDK
jgi:hypothetical protein